MGIEFIEIAEKHKIPVAQFFKITTSNKVKLAKEEIYVVLVDKYGLDRHTAAKLLRTTTNTLGSIAFLRVKQRTQNKE